MDPDRPSSGYAAQMTAGDAWPDIPASTMEENIAAAEKRLQWCVDALQTGCRFRDNLREAVQGDGSPERMHEKASQFTRDMYQLEMQAKEHLAWWRNADSEVVAAKWIITQRVNLELENIASIESATSLKADEKQAQIDAIVNATHAENVQSVLQAAANIPAAVPPVYRPLFTSPSPPVPGVHNGTSAGGTHVTPLGNEHGWTGDGAGAKDANGEKGTTGSKEPNQDKGTDEKSKESDKSKDDQHRSREHGWVGTKADEPDAAADRGWTGSGDSHAQPSVTPAASPMTSAPISGTPAGGSSSVGGTPLSAAGAGSSGFGRVPSAGPSISPSSPTPSVSPASSLSSPSSAMDSAVRAPVSSAATPPPIAPITAHPATNVLPPTAASGGPPPVPVAPPPTTTPASSPPPASAGAPPAGGMPFMSAPPPMASPLSSGAAAPLAATSAAPPPMPAGPTASTTAAVVPMTAAERARQIVAKSTRQQIGDLPGEVRRLAAALTASSKSRPELRWCVGGCPDNGSGPLMVVASNVGLGFLPATTRLPRHTAVHVFADSPSVAWELKQSWVGDPLRAVLGFGRATGRSVTVVGGLPEIVGGAQGVGVELVTPENTPDEGIRGGRDRLEVVDPEKADQIQTLGMSALATLLPTAGGFELAPDAARRGLLWADVLTAATIDQVHQLQAWKAFCADQAAVSAYRVTRAEDDLKAREFFSDYSYFLWNLEQLEAASSA